METLRVMTDTVLRAAIAWRTGVDPHMEDDTGVLSNNDTSAVIEECGGIGISDCDWFVNSASTDGGPRS